MKQPAIVRTIYIDFINSSHIKAYIKEALAKYHLQMVKDLTTQSLHETGIHRAYPVKCERITFAGLVKNFHAFEKSYQWSKIMVNCDGVLSRKCIAY